MASEDLDLVATCRLPQPGCVITTSCQRVFAVDRKRHILKLIGVANEVAKRLPTRHIPKPSVIVLPGNEDGYTVG